MYSYPYGLLFPFEVVAGIEICLADGSEAKQKDPRETCRLTDRPSYRATLHDSQLLIGDMTTFIADGIVDI